MSDVVADAGDGRRRGASAALATIAVLGVVGLLYVAEAVFLPAVLALLLSFLLRPPVRWLERVGVPTALGAVLVMGAIGGVAAVGAVQLSEPTAEWMRRLPNSLPEIREKLESLRRPVDKVNEAAKQMQAATAAPAAGERRPVPVEVTTPSLSKTLVSTTQRFFAGLSITLILLFFLLASGDGFLVRLARLFPTDGAAAGDEVVMGANPEHRAHALLLETEHQMTRYLVVFTLMNLAFGALTWPAMAALGLPNAALWALVGCVFNYIPYLGNLITVTLIGAVSLLSLPDAWEALWPPLAFIVIRAIEGNFVMPWVVSRRFAMNTVAVFVWTVFWTWMWGVLGGFIAVPLLALLKLVSERVERLRPIAAFLEP